MHVPDHAALTPIEDAHVEATVALAESVIKLGEAIEALHPAIVAELRKRDDMLAELRDELHTLSKQVGRHSHQLAALGYRLSVIER